MSIFVLLELPLEVIMSGHIKWNRVSRGVIISMLLLITMGCGHNMRIENSVEQNTVEIQNQGASATPADHDSCSR